MSIRTQTLVAGWLLFTVLLLGAQGLFVSLGGRVETFGVPAVWTASAAVALAGTLAAALRLPRGAVRAAWCLWAVGSGAWLAGAVVTDVSVLAGVELPGLADALWSLFAALGLVGLTLRAPSGSFSLRFFVLDALPVVLLTIGLSRLVLGDLVDEPVVVQVASGVYLVAYIVLALASFQLMAIDGLRRVPPNMWILGPGFILAAAGALLWPGRDALTSPAGVLSGLLWTAGLLVVGASGLRRARSPGSFTRLYRPHQESAARAVPPAAAVVGLVVLLFLVPERALNVLYAFLLAAVLAVGLRFYLARRDFVWSRQALSQSEARYHSLFENARDFVFTLDASGVFTAVNRAGEEITGFSAGELVGASCTTLLPPDVADHVRQQLEDDLTGEARQRMYELEIVRSDGHRATLEVSSRRVEGDEWQCIGRDVTERKRLVEQLRHQAFHDALTGLANRDLFADRVEHALAHRAGGNSSIAVLFLDLDDFKAVNDSLGHPPGDQLLVALATHLRSCTRPSDTCARLGGDEFGILLEDTSTEEAVAVADRVLAALGAPFSLGGRDVFASASIGIALAGVGESGDVLRRNADVAMYEAKARGGGRHVLFETAMLTPAVARLGLRTALQHALERGELVLYYQPICELETGAIVSVEALLRWHHPQRGLIEPAEFLDVAEETGLIVPLSRWLLGEACRLGRAIQGRRPHDAPLRIGVNVSHRHLREPGFTEDVLRALAETGLAAGCLILEITEHAFARDLQGGARLQELREAGVQLALDDFAAGHSSLDQLRRFPVNMLKIDQSFVRSLHAQPGDAVFTDTIIRLGNALGVELVAEGIEHPHQRRRLLELGCRLGQGFLLGPPVDEERLTALVARDTARRALRLTA